MLEQEERDRHKLDRQIAREEDWMRYGVTARRKRNVRGWASWQALRQARRDAVHGPQGLKLEASGTGLSGKLVAVAEGVSKSFDDRAIVRDLDLRVLRGDRLGIVGAERGRQDHAAAAADRGWTRPTTARSSSAARCRW